MPGTRKIFTVEKDFLSINLQEVFLFIRVRRKFLFFGPLVGLVVGILLLIFWERDYAIQVPLRIEDTQQLEESAPLGGLLGKKSNLFGKQEEDFTVRVQEFIKTPDFLLYMIRAPIYFEKLDSTLLLMDYFVDQRTEPLLLDSVEMIAHTFDVNSRYMRKLSSAEQFAIGKFVEQVTVEEAEDESDDPSKMVVAVKMPDPNSAFLMAVEVVEYIKTYFSRYYLHKERQQYDHVQGRFQAAKIQYEAASKSLLHFEQSNQHIRRSIKRLEQEKLQQDMSFKYAIYQQLGVQHEEILSRLQSKSPLIYILEPIYLPSKHSPSNKKVMLISVFAGVFLGVFYIFTLLLLRVLGISFVR